MVDLILYAPGGAQPPLDPFQHARHGSGTGSRAIALRAAPRPASPLTPLMDRLEAVWLEILAAEERCAKLDAQIALPGCVADYVIIPETSIGPTGACTKVEEIEAYYAPAIAAHGKTFVAVRDGYIARLESLRKARAKLGLDRLQDEVDALHDTVAEIETQLDEAPVTSLDDLVEKLRHILLTLRICDPENERYEAEQLVAAIEAARRLAGGRA
jgi:hypothetical protein